eukprot:CAMPEP_0202045070 /NCGR_PEP_ID=MMETSP0963-20130614/481_1 /ASSEMBLY_ACC=CAM_ASM_000494 /TAXON_ID=4773 /ORGANISM="Schizochytrium aggregatum, Strain ATCC28209" /LENGTH=33 /DNA_ID= /DNA_START= /DNA_END= /DNA_ORIENTATION=
MITDPSSQAAADWLAPGSHSGVQTNKSPEAWRP